MIKKIAILLKIGRALAKSSTLDYFQELYRPNFIIRAFIKIFGFSSFRKKSLDSKSVGTRLAGALKKLGPTFIKLGQFLGTRPDIVGNDLAKELQSLQDDLPPFDMSIAKKTIKEEIGEEKFNQIKDLTQPIAAASIAQVHFAKINGEEYAIKILRPGIEKKFNEELDALMLFSSIIESILPRTRRLRLIEVVHLLKEITAIEMDLRFEGSAASELENNTISDPNFIVPKINWDFTSRRILTSQKVKGISIKDLNKIDELKIDKKKLAKDIIQNFLRQAVGDGFFHGDMHQGNLFVDKDGNIIPVDFGIMGRLDVNNRKYLAEILYGFIKRDYEKVADVHFVAGLVPQDQSRESFSQALRSIGEPIFGQSIKNISAGKLLAQLFEVTEQFNMATQPQLLLLQKTMVVVEGVARTLDEDANIWKISKPVLEGWLKQEVGPEAKFKQVVETTNKVIDRLPELPIMMDKASKALELLAAGTVASNNEIAKKFEYEKLKIKNQQNNIIIFILLVVISLLIIFN
ncbi:MAG: 2-polyprenylphenol 6-hydroxylase [Candidatus Pelagibacter sp.]|nr:2-polyprenylphenol 6-hydroxylase [Candidatus Pelagibacter sp.]OUV86937.1 MAG: 2-polyprenylphenol 6-hydroxylase [Pelagibacteraceae bacterium TMED136]|tara:strand:+ start:13363 stop:14919 length:1557 start_codon:yes stop_codon:yes gene_type:complete